jgi:hypothetical protein
LLRQPACSLDNLLTLVFCQLTEPLAAFDASMIRGNESLDAAAQEPNPLSPAENEASADQTLLSPSRYRFCRYLKELAEIVDSVDWFGYILDPKVGRVGDVLDEQTEIVPGGIP